MLNRFERISRIKFGAIESQKVLMCVLSPADGLSIPFLPLLAGSFIVVPFPLPCPFGPNELNGRCWLVLCSFSNAKLSTPSGLVFCFGAKTAWSSSVEFVEISSVVDWMERGDGVGVDTLGGVFIWIRSSESPPTEIVISCRCGAVTATPWSVWSLIIKNDLNGRLYEYWNGRKFAIIIK